MTAIEAMVIRTARLTLLPLRVEHAGEMATVLADPALHEFIGGHPSTVAELHARYTRQVAGSPEPGISWCNWVVRLDADDRLTGYVQATVDSTDATHTTAETAWVVGTPWQGRGIAREAATALVAWLTERDVRAITAHIHPDHAASAAVATAAGLRPTQQWQDGELRWQRG